MGSRYREPRPKSPERIRLISIDSARSDEYGSIEVQATFRYDSWCCSDSHEIADAIATLQKLVYQAAEKAEIKRLKKLREEYEEAFKEVNESRDVQQ